MAIFGAFWLVFGVREAVVGRSGSLLVQMRPTDPKNHAGCNPGSPDDKKGAKGGKKGGTMLGGSAPEPPPTVHKISAVTGSVGGRGRPVRRTAREGLPSDKNRLKSLSS